jgi:hypothetical protein
MDRVVRVTVVVARAAMDRVVRVTVVVVKAARAVTDRVVRVMDAVARAARAVMDRVVRVMDPEVKADRVVKVVEQVTRVILTSTNTSISTDTVMAVVWEMVARAVSRTRHYQHQHQ